MNEADKINDLLKQREEQYGDMIDTHVRIAQVWSGILSTEVTAGQVALCMAGLKLVRAEINPDHQDSFDDAHGYVSISETIYGVKQKPEVKKPGAPCLTSSCDTLAKHQHGPYCKNCSFCRDYVA